MDRDDSTFLPPEQESLQDSSTSLAKESGLYFVAARARKISQDFGWPTLILLALAPGDGISKSEVFYYFLLATPVAFCALTLRLMAQGYDRRQSLVANGPYRYVRNPVELGTLLGYGAAGAALSLPLWYTISLIFLAGLYMSFISIAYERDLKRRFGTAFIKYSSRVRRWLPLSLPATNATMQDYSFHLALKNERWTVLWFVGFLLVYSFRQRLR